MKFGFKINNKMKFFISEIKLCIYLIAILTMVGLTRHFGQHRRRKFTLYM